MNTNSEVPGLLDIKIVDIPGCESKQLIFIKNTNKFNYHDIIRKINSKNRRQGH